jgi:hypothetical protein
LGERLGVDVVLVKTVCACLRAGSMVYSHGTDAGVRTVATILSPAPSI